MASYQDIKARIGNWNGDYKKFKPKLLKNLKIKNLDKSLHFSSSLGEDNDITSLFHAIKLFH